MRALFLASTFLVLLAWLPPAVAEVKPAPAEPAEPTEPVDNGRIGLLPEHCVQRLESNNISERTALVATGVAATAGVGVAAGAVAGASAGATVVLALWLAHLPLDAALFGGPGYLAWMYLWPSQKEPTKPVPTETIAFTTR